MAAARICGAGIVALVAVPLIVLFRAGLQLVDINEESTGYRYFHSLRILYSDERPWLPQGQVLGLMHMAVQSVLTALGYPIEQLFPRLNVWSYVATAIPIPLCVIAYWWAARPIHNWLGRLLLAMGLLFVVSDPVSFAGVSIVSPDYYSWAYVAALVLTGWLIRLDRGEAGWSSRWALALALFTGACVAMKPTYLIFFAPIYLAYYRERCDLRRWAAITGIGVAGVMIGMVIISAYYRFSPPATVYHFRALLAFSSGAISPDSVSNWIARQSMWPPSAMHLSFMLPGLLAISAVVLPRRLTSLSLLACSVLSLLVAIQRFYGATFVETTSVSLALAATWATIVLGPILARGPVTRVIGYALGLTTLVLLAYGAYQQEKYVMEQAVWSSRWHGRAELAITALRQEHPGRSVVLIPDNARRPLTVDSAISKGGTDVEYRRWGTSPFVAALFPDLDFVKAEVEVYERPVQLVDAATLVFVLGPAPGTEGMQAPSDATLEKVWRDARIWLRDLFDVTLNVWECPVSAFTTNNALIIGCHRREEPLAQSAPGWLVPTLNELQPGTQLDDTGGSRHTLADGDIVFVESTGELYRSDPGGKFTRLRAGPGMSVPVQNRGAWNAASQRLEGVSVSSTGDARWTLEASAPMLSGVSLSRATFGREWRLASTLNVATNWRNDKAGPYLRIRSKANDTGVLLQHALQEGPSGTPLTLSIEVRASRPGVDFFLAAYDNSPGAPPQTISRKETVNEDWQTLTLHIPPLASPTVDDRLGGGPSGLRTGEYVDIRLMAVYEGLVP